MLGSPTHASIMWKTRLPSFARVREDGQRSMTQQSSALAYVTRWLHRSSGHGVCSDHASGAGSVGMLRLNGCLGPAHAAPHSSQIPSPSESVSPPLEETVLAPASFRKPNGSISVSAIEKKSDLGAGAQLRDSRQAEFGPSQAYKNRLDRSSHG